MYLPAISDAKHVSSYMFGREIMVMFFTDCTSAGTIQYAHVAFTYRIDPDKPMPQTPPPVILAVASEINQMAQLGGGSHFLGVFPGSGHMNMGASNDWADLEKFTQKALDVIADQLQLNVPPVRLDLGNSRFN